MLSPETQIVTGRGARRSSRWAILDRDGLRRMPAGGSSGANATGNACFGGQPGPLVSGINSPAMPVHLTL
jgi:hypothetical protein